MAGLEAGKAAGFGGAERRHITVMFCDLVGSSRLGAELDPEDFSDLVVAYRRTAAFVIERYGGFVARYVGDGILACWGYPRASENDSLRCLAAALELVDSVPPLGRDLPYLKRDLQIRVAVEAGICVVGAIGDAEADIVGEAPNTAAGLQSNAPPNGIITTKALKTVAEAAFEFADAGKVTLKSNDEAIDTYRVVGQRRLWWRTDPTETEIVGRADECARLDAYWRQVRAAEARSLVIVGEPGIGKSTVLGHLRRLVTADRAIWREAACAPEGEQSPLQPIRDILLQDIGLTWFDDASRSGEALGAYLERLGMGTEESTGVLSMFLDLPGATGLSAEWPPARFREVLFETLFNVLERRAVEAPFALAIEDAHWSDPTSREFLLELERDRLPAGCALVFTTRSWPEKEAGALPDRTVIELERLQDKVIAEIFSNEVGEGQIPPDALQAFVEQCDGVPFYASQVAQLIARTGLPDAGAKLPAIDMSAALSDWLLARLDAAGEHKSLLQNASVMGRTFHASLLGAVADISRDQLDEILLALDDQGFVRAMSPGPTGTHAFRHVLLREIAYHTMLRGRVRQLHGRVAQAITKEFPALAQSRPDIVAGHFEAAGCSLDAFHWWARAGDRSVAQGAAVEAKAAYHRALAAIEGVAVTDELRERELDVRASHIMQISLVDGASRDALRDACTELLARAHEYGDPAPKHRFRAQWVLNFHHVNRGEITSALPHAEGLLTLAQQVDSPGLLMQANRFAALSHLFAGNIERAVSHYETALASHDPDRDKDHRFEFGSEPGVVIRAQLALAQTLAGNAPRADALDAEATALAETIGHPHSLVHALSFSATRLALARALDQASTRLEEALAACEAKGFAYWAAWNGLTRAVIEARRDIGASDRGQLQSAADRYAAFGARQGLAFLDLVIGEHLLARGSLDDAIEHLDTAIASWRSSGLRLFEPAMRALRAVAAFRRDGDRAALEAERNQILAGCQSGGAGGIRAEVERIFVDAL